MRCVNISRLVSPANVKAFRKSCIHTYMCECVYQRQMAALEGRVGSENLSNLSISTLTDEFKEAMSQDAQDD